MVDSFVQIFHILCLVALSVTESGVIKFPTRIVEKKKKKTSPGLRIPPLPCRASPGLFGRMLAGLQPVPEIDYLEEIW